MKPCECGSGLYIAKEGGDGKCAKCRKARKQRRAVSSAATREEQNARYIDCGPAAWDDR